uniref:Uncharacterized protein n=1 Tax=Ananas comosus var. bracteatus TaxID=296719 RepID=A0A6V7NYR5_ANACO|nr:unnamed protein product [Ananas comosus var. bracteatus]
MGNNEGKVRAETWSPAWREAVKSSNNGADDSRPPRRRLCSALLLSATLAEPFLFDDLFYNPQPVDGDAPPLDPVAADDNGLTPPPVKPSNVPPPKAVILPLDEGAGFAGGGRS